MFGSLGGKKNYDVVPLFAEGVANLKGYRLSDSQRDIYFCHKCGRTGVKLWRRTHIFGDSVKGWCSFCAMEQAGYADTVDSEGRNHEGEYSGPRGSDQIYSSKQGVGLAPWVPCPHDGTWGYTSVPAEGCLWWKTIPTR